MSENRNDRPTFAKVERPNVSAGWLDKSKDTPDPNTSEDVVRCGVCGHPVWSEESVAAGIGRDCRRALRRARQFVDDLAGVA